MVWLICLCRFILNKYKKISFNQCVTLNSQDVSKMSLARTLCRSFALRGSSLVAINRCSLIDVGKLDRRVASPPILSRQLQSASQPAASVMYVAEERGSEYAPDYRVFFRDENGPISPMHDIPLWADKAGRVVNMVVEVPRWSNAKMEISLGETLNPIKQDVKKGALRYVANVFPHHGYIWNYGALPQTWENPSHVDPHTQCRGDNDPIDVLEVGSRVARRGDVVPVRVLGALALIDEGETDWKLLAVDTRDPLAARLHDVADLEAACPGLLKATVEWFRLYKVPDGKPVNQFAFDAQPKNADFAYKVIEETHEFWQGLVSGAGTSGMSLANVSVSSSPHRVSRAAAAAALAAAAPRADPQPLPDTVDKCHYLSNL